MAGTIGVEKEFTLALGKYLEETKGGVLRELAEYAEVKGAGNYSFARASKATAQDGVVDLLGEHTGNAGDVKYVEVTLAPISSAQLVPKHSLMKTKLDVKNTWVQQMGNAVDIKEDEKIVAAIKAKTDGLTKLAITGDLDTTENAKKVIGAVNGRISRAKLSTAGVKGVGLVLSQKRWDELSMTDYVLNQDFNKSFNGSKDGDGNFFGAKVYITESVGDDKIYVIPSMSFGLAENPDGREGSAEYYAAKSMSYALVASKTIGTDVLDEKAIVEITLS